MDALPVFIRLQGRRVVVVGDGDAAAAKARLVMGAGGVVVTEPPAGLAFVALDDAADAAAAAVRLRAAGCLVNVVDRPALCDFTVPAIVDRSPVVVAIGTGGASASLAKALRERLEALLPSGLGRLAEAIYAARAAIIARAPTVAARRGLWDAALAPGGALDPLRDTGPCDVDTVLDRLAGIEPSRAGASTTIRLTSTDPDDLTLRQLRALTQADTVVYDAAVPAAVLDRARRDAVRVAGPVAEPPPGRTVVLTT